MAVCAMLIGCVGDLSDDLAPGSVSPPDPGAPSAPDGGVAPDAGSPNNSGPPSNHGAAAGIQLTSITINQAVEIDLVQDGRVIDVDDRVAPVISGRAALVRAAWTVDPGFVGRELEAQLVIRGDDGSTQTLLHRRSVTGPADMTELVGGFYWLLDAGQVSPDAVLHVEVVETSDAPQTGDTSNYRLPAQGEAQLGAWAEPMVLDVVVVPMCGLTLTEEDKAMLRSYLFNVYPISELDLTFHAPLNGVCDVGEATFSALPRLRAEENAPDHRHYGGIIRGSCGGIAQYVEPNERFAERTFSLCDWRDVGPTFDLFAHELGHTHGRQHTFEDSEYPYANNGDCGARVTNGYGLLPGFMPTTHYSNDIAIGYDWANMQDLIPPTDPQDCGNNFYSWSDMMSYTYPYWVSAHTYRKLAEEIRRTTAWSRSAKSTRVAVTLKAFVDGDKVHWSKSRAAPTAFKQLLVKGARVLQGDTLLRSFDVGVRMIHRDSPGGAEAIDAGAPLLSIVLPDGMQGDRAEVDFQGRTLSVDLNSLRY